MHPHIKIVSRENARRSDYEAVVGAQDDDPVMNSMVNYDEIDQISKGFVPMIAMPNDKYHLIHVKGLEPVLKAEQVRESKFRNLDLMQRDSMIAEEFGKLEETMTRCALEGGVDMKDGQAQASIHASAHMQRSSIDVSAQDYSRWSNPLSPTYSGMRLRQLEVTEGRQDKLLDATKLLHVSHNQYQSYSNIHSNQ